MMIGQISAELQPTSHEGDPLPSLFDFLKAPFILAANGDRAINQPEMNEGREQDLSNGLWPPPRCNQLVTFELRTTRLSGTT